VKQNKPDKSIQELTSLQTELRDVRAENEHLKKQLSTTQNEKKYLEIAFQKKLKLMDQTLHKKTQEIEQHDAANSIEKSSTSNELNRLRAEISDMSRLTMENKQLTSQNERKSLEAQMQEQEIDQMKKQIKKLKQFETQNTNLLREVSTLESTRRKLEETEKALSKAQQESEQHSQNLRVQNEQSQIQIQKIQSQINDNGSDSSKQNEELMKQIQQLTEDLKSEKQRYSEIQTEKQNLEQTITDQQEIISANKSAESESRETINQLYQENAKLKTQIEEQSNSAPSVTSTVDNSEEIEALQKEVDSRTEQVGDLSKELVSVKKKRDELQKEVQNSSAKSHTLLYLNRLDGTSPEYLKKLLSNETDGIVLDNTVALTNELLKELATFIEKSFSHLTYFIWRNESADISQVTEGIDHLFKMLTKCPSLKTFELSNMNLRDAKLHYYITSARDKFGVTKLLLNNVYFGQLGNALGRALTTKRSYVYEELVIRKGKLGQAAMLALTQIPVVRILELPDNDFDNTVNLVAKSKIEWKTLQVLNISGNNVGVEGANALAERFNDMKAIKTISLNRTKLGVEGLAAIAAKINKCQTIEVLELDGNGFTDDALKSLELIMNLSNLSILKLASNDFSPDGVQTLKKHTQGVVQLDIADQIGSQPSTPTSDGNRTPDRLKYIFKREPIQLKETPSIQIDIASPVKQQEQTYSPVEESSQSPATEATAENTSNTAATSSNEEQSENSTTSEIEVPSTTTVSEPESTTTTSEEEKNTDQEE
jgi:hypothetical protein